MIIVAGHLTINPEHRDAALDAVRACMAATQAEEGNLEYRFSPDLQEPDRLNLIERWADQEAMDSHMGTEHMAAFLGAIGPCVSGPVEIVRYDVSGSAPLF